MLRLAGSLKLGRVPAADIMRTLQVGDRPTRLAQAIAEFGRIDKTLHTLTYIDDEAKRRGTLTQRCPGRISWQARRITPALPRRAGRPVGGARFGTEHDRLVEHHLHGCRLGSTAR
jgi:hypothetical protein